MPPISSDSFRLIVYIDTRLITVLISDETGFFDENNEYIHQEELMHVRSNTSTRSLQGVWTVRFSGQVSFLG
jgi:hypothetical protein